MMYSGEESNWTVGECLVTDRSHTMVICDVCTSVMFKPVVLECGHTFCDECVERLQASSQDRRKCPSCRYPLSASSANVALATLVSSLSARCLNDGCTWTGTVDGHEFHLTQCQYRLTGCKYASVGCPVQTQRRKCEKHYQECPYRPATCTWCQLEIPIVLLNTHKDTKCKKRKVLCPYFKGPNDCHQVVISDATQHMFACPSRIQTCEVRGCNFRGNHEAMQQHEKSNMRKHNELLIRDHRNVMVLLKTKPTSAMTRYEEEVLGAWSYTWCIGEEDNDQMASAKARGLPLTSPEFSGLVNGATMKWRLLLYLNTGEISVQLVEGEQGPHIFKMLFAIEDGDKSPTMTVPLNKGETAGWKSRSWLRNRNLLPLVIRVTLTLVRYI